MARILLAGNFGAKSLGKICYNVDRKLKNGLVRAGHHVWEFSDRDVARASTPFLSRKVGIAPANKKFLETIENYRPEIILLGHADVISNATLLSVREKYRDVPIAIFNLDALFYENNVKALREWSEIADYMFITTGGELLKQFLPKHYPQSRARAVCYMPNPIDASIENGRAFEHKDLPYDVFFGIGGIVTKETATDPRQEIADYLLNEAPELRYRWLGLYGHGGKWGHEFAETIQEAKIGFNFSRQNDVYLYSSDRMAAIMGHGLLCVMDAAAGFQKFFTDGEVAFYKDKEDLVKKLKYYAGDDAARMAAARAGWEKAHREFSATLVAQYIVETILGQKYSHDYLWRSEIFKN